MMSKKELEEMDKQAKLEPKFDPKTQKPLPPHGYIMREGSPKRYLIPRNKKF